MNQAARSSLLKAGQLRVWEFQMQREHPLVERWYSGGALVPDIVPRIAETPCRQTADFTGILPFLPVGIGSGAIVWRVSGVPMVGFWT